MKFAGDYRFSRILFLPLFLTMLLMVSHGWVDAAMQDEGIDRGLYDKTVDPPMSDEQLRSSEKFWEETEDFILIGDLQAFGTYSHLNSDEEWGGSAYGLIAPGYKVGEKMLFILMYDGQYDRRLELYSDEYGPRKRTEFQRHALTPMLRIDFGEDSRYSITPAVFFTSTWNKDGGQGDSWDKGLYNYEDKGVSLDFNMRRLFGEYDVFKMGMQWYARDYPNYTFDLDLGGAGTSQEEKDYHGLITTLGYSWITDSGLSWVLEYSLLYKKLDDQRVVQSNGELSSSTKRRDYIHELELGFWYTFEDIAGGLELGVDLGIRIKDSNQNFLYLPGIAPQPWTVNRNFFDYRSYRIVPNVKYIFEQMPLTVRLSYAYEKVDYTDRWAKDSLGSVDEMDEQWESAHQVLLGLQYELSEKLSLIGQLQYLNGGSNDDDESVYVFDYSLYNCLVGFKYSF